MEALVARVDLIEDQIMKIKEAIPSMVEDSTSSSPQSPDVGGRRRRSRRGKKLRKSIRSRRH